MRGQRLVWEMPGGTIVIGKSLIDDHDAFAAKVEAHPEMVGARRLSDLADDERPPRRWRACWRNRGDGRLHVDLPLARQQRLAEIRAERDRRLAALDGPWMRAMGQGGNAAAAAIEATRQALRDLPNRLVAEGTLEALATPEALEAWEPTWPDGPAPP